MTDKVELGSTYLVGGNTASCLTQETFKISRFNAEAELVQVKQQVAVYLELAQGGILPALVVAFIF